MIVVPNDPNPRSPEALLRIRSVAAACLAAAALTLTGVGAGYALAADPAPTGPDTQACADAKKDVTDLKGALDLAVAGELESETTALNGAKAELAGALPVLLTFAEADYPDQKRPTLADLTPAYLDRMLNDSNLGDGAQKDVKVAQGKAQAVTAAEAALKVDNEATAGARARHQLALQAETKSCTPTAPPAETCQTATSKLGIAISETITYNANAYPDNKVPTLGQITPAYLEKVKADPDLGADGQAEVQTALDAFKLKDQLCGTAGNGGNAGDNDDDPATGGNTGNGNGGTTGSNGSSGSTGNSTGVSDVSSGSSSDSVLPATAAETGGYTLR